MTPREYIGARYVPLFMGDWDIDADYEPLSIVQYQGNSYTSRQSVPHGVQITNTHYWALTGNYNAQVEEYRQEVLSLDGRVTQNALDIDALEATVSPYTSVNTIASAIGELESTVSPYTSSSTIASAIGELESTVSPYTSSSTIASAIGELEATVSPYTSANTIAEAIEGVKTSSERNYLGVIGDSFSYGQYSDWITPTVQRMGFNGVVNVSNGSMGWIHGNTNFQIQFDNLVADANFSKVTDIIIYGGVNDYRAETKDPDDLVSAFDAIKAKYDALPAPRPRLFVCFGNGYSRASSYMLGYHDFVCKCNTRLRRRGFQVFENVDQWLMCEITNCDYGDGVHPNNYGAYVISGYMCQVLQNSYNGVHKSQRVNLTVAGGDPVDGYVQYRLDDGVIGFELRTTTQLTGFSATAPYVRLYTPSSLQMSIGQPGNISGIQHAIFSSEPIKMATDSSNIAYYVAILSLTDNSIGVLLKGSGSNSTNYALMGAYTNTGAIGCASAPVF